jgi:hypothetical protein
MMTHPPWSRFGAVGTRLRELCSQIAERVVRLLGDGLGEAVRSVTQLLLLTRSRPQPRRFERDDDPFLDSERPNTLFDTLDVDEDDLAFPEDLREPLVEQPRRTQQPLWKRTLLSGLRGLHWCVVELPARRPVLTTVVVAVTTTLLGCWLGPAAGLLGTALSVLSLIVTNSTLAFT